MKTIIVAELLQELYYQGKVRSDRGMDERDFVQLTQLARGEAIRMEIERSFRLFGLESIFEGGIMQHYATLVTKKVDENEIMLDDVMNLQFGLGLYNIIGAPNTSVCSDKLYFSRILSGTAWQLKCDEMEDNEVAFEHLGNKVRFHNLPECADEIELLVIKEDGMDDEIPSDIGYTILKMAFEIAFKTNTFVADSLDDYSSTDDQKRNLLAQYQANDERANKSI